MFRLGVVRVDEVVFLGIIALLIVLAVPVAIVLLFIRSAGLSDRVMQLERLLDDQAHKLGMLAVQRRGDAGTAMETNVAPVVIAEPEIAPEAVPEPDMSDIAASLPSVDDTAPVVTPEPLRANAWDRAVGKQAAAVETTDAPLRRTGAASDTADQSDPEAPSRLDALIAWLQVNWIYAISAASLGLAGIFFVQYGMEKGLLPPALRVIMAILFGGALIGAGEWLRRKHGDEGDTTTIYLPSVFAGAGLVSIFAATLAARHMYGLITPEVAFAGHLFTAALAVALGWFYGPLLAAVGLIGAALSPFIVEGGSDAAPWLYAYFALIAAAGLGIDAVRQWRWLSVLALCLGYGGGFLTWAAGAGDAGWIVFAVVMTYGAMLIPTLSLTPRHAGPFMLQILLGQAGGIRPSPPVRLAFGAAVASAVGLFMATGSADVAMPAAFALTTLALIYLLCAEKAEGLADLAIIPAISFLLTLLSQALADGQLFADFQRQAIALRAPETSGPIEVTLLIAMAVAISAAAAWRALRKQDWLLDLIYGLTAVLTAPVAIAILELLWSPAPIIGLPFWATHIIGVAALMTWLATRFAAVDMGDMRRTAYATLSALSLVALALFLMTTATALTLALAVLILVAASLDRRFNLAEMGLFIQIGVAVLTYRLLIDPGLDYALDASIPPVLLSFVGSIAAMIAARRIIPQRPLTHAVLESAAAGLSAMFANVLIARLIMPDAPDIYATAWWVSLQAMPWIVLMLAQLYRTQASDTLKSLRYGLAAISGVIGAGTLALSVGPFNPLFAYSTTNASGLVQGPLILNSLFIAYAMPGLLLLAGWRLMPGLSHRLRLGFLAVGSALIGLYTMLEIRHWFQGAFIGGPDVTQGELYTYTLALMLLGAALLIQSIRKGSPLLRRMAMGVIGLVIAKVFLMDAAGLTGLIRVFSFLGLGLSLAGLAWLNRWAERSAQHQ